VDTNSSPKSRLADAIDFESIARIDQFTRYPDAMALIMHEKMMRIEVFWNRIVRPERAMVVTVIRARETGVEGKTNKCLYLLES
jgi:hypothetical protein